MKRAWSDTQEEEYGQLGIIESVSLRNFMCHENLSFEFDPHMNFIVGRNGSGKSAVLTGIILALGGKSGATGRYSSVKGFVKNGKSSASVAVTLKNCGPDAYKPTDFGKKIIVERNFNTDGISTYKLKSEKGKIVSTSKEELSNMLSIMDIQIENPMTVLNQDMSKNFFNSKPDKLFHLFYMGTGLSKLHDDYNISVRQKEDAKRELKNKKSILPEMEKDVKRLKTLLDKSSKIIELKKELLWAIVIELEKKRDESQEALDKVVRDSTDFKKKLKTFETELNNVTQTVTTSTNEKKACCIKMDGIRKDLGELNQQRSTQNSEIRQIQGTYSSHEREVKKFSSEILSLERIINEVKMKNQQTLNEDKLRHEMALNNLKSQIHDIKSQTQMLVTQKDELRQSHAKIQSKIDTANAELQEIVYEKNNILTEKSQLIQGMSNKINVYGPEMSNVLQDIQRAAESGAFRVIPKGPIGLYITVKQQEWNFAVQECIRAKNLKSFICDNHADADLLARILNKHYARNPPSIITTKFVPDVYDVSAHKTNCEYPTLLDMLDIEDSVITNCLIDQIQIENILLIGDQSQAVKLMLYSPPAKCRFAYTPNGNLYCHSPFRDYSCRNRNQVCLLKTINEDDIRKKDEDLMVLNQAEIEKRDDKGSLVKQLQLTEPNIRRIDNEIMQLRIKLNQLQMELRNEENSYEEPKDVNCLQSDLDQMQKEREHHEERLAASRDLLNSKNQELSTLDENIEHLKRNLQVESRNFHSLSEKVEEMESKKEKYDSVIKKIKDQLTKFEPIIEKQKKELSNDVASAEIATKNASVVSDRIETGKSPEAIRQFLKETEKFVQKQKNCDRQAILTEYEEKIKALNRAKVELQKQEKFHSRLDQMMVVRFERYEQFCRNVTSPLVCTFIAMLQENNFTGYPDVNFEEQTLEIIAKPNERNAEHANRHNLTQLSGGERSYVTIAFLLALWERIQMPFRILDEYDVFMDSNNRHLSIHLLINTAKSNKNIQYIFLSPLELPQIDNSDNVKIHKMPAPRK